MSSRIAAANVKLKRVYDPPAASDGTRILVDRLWPRGVKKANAAIDQWDKSIAPSTRLRNWFGHDPARWQEFRQRYASEIHGRREELAALRARAESGRITLIFAAHDKMHNHAIVLRDVLLGRAEKHGHRSTADGSGFLWETPDTEKYESDTFHCAMPIAERWNFAAVFQRLAGDATPPIPASVRPKKPDGGGRNKLS